MFFYITILDVVGVTIGDGGGTIIITMAAILTIMNLIRLSNCSSQMLKLTSICNNQLIQDLSWNNINLTTPQQCISSSSGKSYVYLPVKVYSTNITSKSFHMNLNVRIRSAVTSDVWNAGTSGELSISNGEIYTSFGSVSNVHVCCECTFYALVGGGIQLVTSPDNKVVHLCFCVCDVCVCVCVCMCV